MEMEQDAGRVEKSKELRCGYTTGSCAAAAAKAAAGNALFRRGNPQVSLMTPEGDRTVIWK